MMIREYCDDDDEQAWLRCYTQGRKCSELLNDKEVTANMTNNVYGFLKK